MADAVVNILFQNLNKFLQEVSLQEEARSNFEEIKKELESMRSFLKDADRRKDGDQALRTWVWQVRNATYNVEDIIDEFLFRMNKPQRSGWAYYVLKNIRIPKMMFHRHRLANQLNEAKTQIAGISRRKDQYQLSPVGHAYGTSERWQHRAGISAFMDSGEMIGLQEKINELIEWLTMDDPRRNVIAIVGMGGLGKTTLAAQTYKKERLRTHFDCYAWVSVSQSYRIEELLKILIKDLFRVNEADPPTDLNSMILMQLLDTVTQYLAMKRYVIVVDDVWDLEAWNVLNVAFPQNEQGSRIILTTRQDNVARGLGNGSHPYQLEPLEEQEAWDLFYRNAFFGEPCPRELEPLARSFVRKCEGLPLAIVTLGSLLSLREKRVPEWDKVYNDLSRQLNENEPIKNILLLSFYDLPYNLKHCFLYCCTFPEDFSIKRKRIIRLWLAEGFVEDGNQITMESAAEEYLKELVHRSMLQVFETNHVERIKCLQVHDILREVALSVSKEEKFCLIHDGQKEIRQGEDEFRRLSVHAVGNKAICSNVQRVRSVLVFDKSSISFSSSLNTMVSTYRLMKVLHLEGLPIKTLPDAVTSLFNLRYLSLRNTQVNELPKSLGKLKNLQTLDIRETNVVRVPIGIVRLQKLRHLICYRLIDSDFESVNSFTSLSIPPQLCGVTSLQTLTFVEATDEIAREVGNLTQLRKLAITKVRGGDGVDLCASITKMKQLAHLIIEAINEEEELQLEALCPSPPLLQKLVVRGHLKTVPPWLGSVYNLTYLELGWSRVSEEEGVSLLLMLQALPNLLCLSLTKTIEGRKLRFEKGWFLKLKELSILHFTQLNQVVIDKGAMPSLQELVLGDCTELKTLPQGIEHLHNLGGLLLARMSLEFVSKLRTRDGNKERQKVAHIPRVVLGRKAENGQWEIERLS